MGHTEHYMYSINYSTHKSQPQTTHNFKHLHSIMTVDVTLLQSSIWHL